jgi:hypothetical protein
MREVIAVVCGIASLFFLGVFGLALFHVFPDGNNAWNSYFSFFSVGLICIALGGLGYAAAWTLGWILAGFVGDDDNS